MNGVGEVSRTYLAEWYEETSYSQCFASFDGADVEETDGMGTAEFFFLLE